MIGNLRFFLFILPLALAGCATVNDSGVSLHRKPDLSAVAPGTLVSQVSGLRKPVERETIGEGKLKGAEVWLYEWDLPDDDVNNKMFTSVVVKDGVILGYSEETPDKWQKNPQLHKMAKLDSAFEDIESLKAKAARYPMAEPLASGQWNAPATDAIYLLMRLSHFILQADNSVAVAVSSARKWEVRPHGRQVGPPEISLPGQEEQSILAAAEASGPLPTGAGDPALAAAMPPTSVALPLDDAAAPASQLTAANESATALAANLPTTAVEPLKKTLAELEAEELLIRKDASLSKAQRMEKLREIWKRQLEVTGKKAA